MIEYVAEIETTATFDNIKEAILMCNTLEFISYSKLPIIIQINNILPYNLQKRSKIEKINSYRYVFLLALELN